MTALLPCPFCNTAPSFGRMIEPEHVTIGCNNDGCLVQLCVVSEAEADAIKAWNTRAALAALKPDGERREAIAPCTYVGPCGWKDASGLVQDEAAIRADCVSVSQDVLLTLISALDCALGDTDPSINEDYTDDEIRRDYPVFWVCQQLAAILRAAKSGLNYIANTEAELGITLESGDLLREAIGKIESYIDAGRSPRAQSEEK